MARRAVIIALLVVFMGYIGLLYHDRQLNPALYAFKQLHRKIEKEYGFTVGSTGLLSDLENNSIFHIEYISKTPLNWLEGVKAYKVFSALYIEEANQKPKLLKKYGIQEFGPKNLKMWISNPDLDATIPLDQRFYYLETIFVKQEQALVTLINEELKPWAGDCTREELLKAAEGTDITNYSFLKPSPYNRNMLRITEHPDYIRYYQEGLARQKKKNNAIPRESVSKNCPRSNF